MEKIARIKLLILALLIVLVLTGCAIESNAGENNPFEDRFAREYLENYMYLIVDKITGVCYLAYIHNGSGLTVMLDADGTPLTYSEAWYQVYGEVEP